MINNEGKNKKYLSKILGEDGNAVNIVISDSPVTEDLFQGFDKGHMIDISEFFDGNEGDFYSVLEKVLEEEIKRREMEEKAPKDTKREGLILEIDYNSPFVAELIYKTEKYKDNRYNIMSVMDILEQEDNYEAYCLDFDRVVKLDKESKKSRLVFSNYNGKINNPRLTRELLESTFVIIQKTERSMISVNYLIENLHKIKTFYIKGRGSSKVLPVKSEDMFKELLLNGEQSIKDRLSDHSIFID